MSEPHDDSFFDDADGGGTTVSPVIVEPPFLTPQEQAALEQAPKLANRPGWSLSDSAGKLWNTPNTAFGLVYGGVGMGVGELMHLFGHHPAPAVRWRDNAFQFTNNPFGGAGTITLGNTTTWSGDPNDPNDQGWANRARIDGHPIQQHELQHTYQGQQLGPFYLPSNILGGLNALAHGEDWWGDHNWNERGPKANPPRPWKSGS